jgi:hypothetical protein
VSDADRCLTPRELARRWRVRPAKVRAMIRAGTLPAITIDGRTRVTPEAVASAEAGPLAVRPRRTRRREAVPAEVARLLDG